MTKTTKEYAGTHTVQRFQVKNLKELVKSAQSISHITADKLTYDQALQAVLGELKALREKTAITA